MSTTGLVMTVTDELLAELEELAFEYNQHGGNWYEPRHMAAFPEYSCDQDFVVSANPATITALTAELRRLRAENAELAQSLAESRANDQAAMGWLSAYRVAARGGDMPLPEMVSHIEGLAKDSGRYRWICSVKGLSVTSDGSTWTRQDGRAYVSAHTLCANGSQYAGRETLSDAIDTAMATQ